MISFKLFTIPAIIKPILPDQPVSESQDSDIKLLAFNLRRSGVIPQKGIKDPRKLAKIINDEEVNLDDMIWANKLAKANTSANEMLKMARRQASQNIEEGSTDDFLNRMGLGDPDPSNHKKGFTDADDIKSWFHQDKPDDWRQRD